MRVVHYTDVFTTLSMTFIYDYVTEMQRQGIDGHVVTLRHENMRERPFEHVHVVGLPPSWHPERIWAKAKLLASLTDRYEAHAPILRRRIARILKMLRPDVVHAQFGSDAVLIAPVTNSLNIPLVTTFHGADISVLPKSARWQSHYEILFQLGDHFIGVSNYICRKIIQTGADPAKVSMIHNGIRLERFQYSDPVSHFNGRNIRCIHVGRLTHKKDPLSLLEAFNLARNAIGNNLELTLTIAGDGPLRQAVEEKIRALHIQNCVDVLGAIPHSRVSELLCNSHIYTQHCATGPDGDEEGMGVSFAEASAIGLPIVSTVHNGIPDVVLDGVTGFLVPEKDVIGMAARIGELCKTPSLWRNFGSAGRKHVEMHFDLVKQVRMATSLLSKVAKQATAS